MNGPTVAEALLSLALDSSSAERPSKSRRFTSLPSVAPTILPLAETTSTTSGSGLFQVERGCSPASMPCPTADIGCALVKISASSPMPTSRYCDHAPAAISAFFNSNACAEPGFSLRRSPPSCSCTFARMASAFSGAPLACSSITRSTIERANVTPAALMACRSIGASSHAAYCRSAITSGVLARMSASEPIRSPSASRTNFAGSAASHRSRMVAAWREMSYTPSARTATTDGPPTSGRQTRPASAPCRAIPRQRRGFRHMVTHRRPFPSCPLVNRSCGPPHLPAGWRATPAARSASCRWT